MADIQYNNSPEINQTSFLSDYDRQMLNKFASKEMYAHNFYLCISNYMRKYGFFGAQAWFENESKDEEKHYKIHADFMDEMGDCNELPEIPEPDEDVENIGQALDAAFNLENDLLNDYVSYYEAAPTIIKQFLLQFLEIQRVSRGEYLNFKARYKQVGFDTSAILAFDKYMGEQSEK